MVSKALMADAPPTDGLPADVVGTLAEAVAGLERTSLRERKKRATMRRVQQVAVELFEEHGFDRVSIERIAEEAEVSPSTIYRYFATKEGLVLRDEYDEAVLAVSAQLFSVYDPWTAFTRAMGALEGTHFVAGDLSMRRLRLWQVTPQIHAAGFVMLHEIGRALAQTMHAHDHYGRSLADYEVVGGAMMAAFYAALERWYADHDDLDVTALVSESLELIRPAWATPIDLT